jgi:4-hydroxybenzoate polyprenyltransferase
MVSALINSMRPRQWTKNFIVFAGVIFAQRLDDRQALTDAFIAFALFCFLSSSGYLINDLLDAESDRRHPEKCRRPIASGLLSPAAAVSTAIILALAGLALAFWINRMLGFLALGYFILTTTYSFTVKHVVILDAMSIAVGFVIRAAAGAEAILVPISPWLLLCTFMLALFLALTKRRHELTLLENGATSHRPILAEYNTYLLDQMIAVVTASTLVCYSLYTLGPETVAKFHTHNLALTIPFVLFGIFRYLYLVHQKGEGGKPEKILVGDPPFIINMLLWLLVAVAVLYGPESFR